MNDKKNTNLDKIEGKISEWLKPVPDFSVKTRKWLSKNIWWIIAIVAGLLALAIIANIFEMIMGLTSNTHTLKIISLSVMPGFGPKVWVTGSTRSISLLFLIAATIINTMAIIPLKDNRKKGWDLLFLMLIVLTIWKLVSIILDFNIFFFIPSLFFGIFLLACWAHLLLQIKRDFK